MLAVQVPPELGQLNRLAWSSFGGNPLCALPKAPLQVPLLEADQLCMGPALGDGASGDVFQAAWNGAEVAVKVFRSDVSPDGRAQDEISVAACLDHPNLIKYGLQACSALYGSQP